MRRNAAGLAVHTLPSLYIVLPGRTRRLRRSIRRMTVSAQYAQHTDVHGRPFAAARRTRPRRTLAARPPLSSRSCNLTIALTDGILDGAHRGRNETVRELPSHPSTFRPAHHPRLLVTETSPHSGIPTSQLEAVSGAHCRIADGDIPIYSGSAFPPSSTALGSIWIRTIADSSPLAFSPVSTHVPSPTAPLQSKPLRSPPRGMSAIPSMHVARFTRPHDAIRTNPFAPSTPLHAIIYSRCRRLERAGALGHTPPTALPAAPRARPPLTRSASLGVSGGATAHASLPHSSTQQTPGRTGPR
ncbi:hypothetical protein DFH08DRAFT_1086303 [Mycena albidolilacea]|uniref:Uncharacterized protein n=1 Tax=Mycena albidolilacea TaxID=1033008 RepID=A0AAD6ZFD3_9AGAR|nr:hypothetical protein DFH08DRAFT_1086303 [Mycena albidolilacea]